MSVLVTGGAGFIGANLCHDLLERGEEVHLVDNFSRYGTLINLRWLEETHPSGLHIVPADIRTDVNILRGLMDKVDTVYHLAAQVAVTTSVIDPRLDFEINALGTFNVLEAVRTSKRQPSLIFASTNKVYGEMVEMDIVERNGRYEYFDLPFGVPETQPLDFHSPYGCSKGCADQYVIDYGRIYGLNTVSLRQSCIYGIHQFGVEDQGWVAHFTISAIYKRPITIYGDGKQVRDVLYIDDLINLYHLVREKMSVARGKAYNIGGGPANRMSLLELIAFLEKFTDDKIKLSFSDWRPGDQKVFVCDIRKAQSELGWSPKVSVFEGVEKLAKWVHDNREIFKKLYS